MIPSLVGGVVIWACALARAQEPPTPVDPQAFADTIQVEVAKIRGLPFKRPVKAAVQSPEEFGKYVEKELTNGMPKSLVLHYGKIVRKLGLYRGPEITAPLDLMKMVATTQAAAYYDPDKQTFFVLMQDMPELLLGSFYSHELYHGLQDQYFDLKSYLMEPHKAASLNADQLLARQAVVEGEAMYIMTLWGVQRMTGRLPPRQVVGQALALQSQMDMEAIRTMLKQPQFASVVGEQMQSSLDAVDDIPPFIIETLMGAYLKGANFIFAVEEQGWSEVEKLYKEYPPASTEQILHPEKWFAREHPTTITWPSLRRAQALRDWELIDQNVIGEVQLRHVLKEHGLGAHSNVAAAGWDGDRYAVLKRKDSDALLLMLYTCWDDEAEATEFADAYRQLLAVKYPDSSEPTRLEQRGRDVVIVEGGDPGTLDALMALTISAKKTKTKH